MQNDPIDSIVVVEFANLSDREGFVNLSYKVIFVIKSYWVGGRSIPLTQLKTVVMEQSLYASLKLMHPAA